MAVQVGAADEAERLVAALSEGGAVQMPIGETWNLVRFGMVTDRFGVPWMIHCEIAARAWQAAPSERRKKPEAG